MTTKTLKVKSEQQSVENNNNTNKNNNHHKKEFVVTCIFCDREKAANDPPTGNNGASEGNSTDGSISKSASVTKSESASEDSTDSDAYFICSACQMSEKAEATEAVLASTLLGKENCIRAVPMGCEKYGCEHDGQDPCKCQQCVDRRFSEMEQEQEEELRTLQKNWVDLRQAIRQMYRDGLDKQLKTGKGKQFEEEKLRHLVHDLCEKDAHQLYQRLESQGREYVMEIKVNLLQVIVSPEKFGLEPGADGGISVDQAKLFLKNTLDAFSRYQETVRNMTGFINELNTSHLEKFGVTWKLINHHLFDAIVYQDAIIVNTLPLIGNTLNVPLSCPDEESDADKKEREERESKAELPSGALELAHSFRALDRLMHTSGQIWEKANRRMEDYTTKQMKLYKATLKAKQKMLKADLEFFKQQRRLLEKYVAKSKEKHTGEAVKESSEEELAQFAETLRNVLAKGRPSRPHNTVTSQVECTRCHMKHCPCDECAISHVITCGLVTDADQDLCLEGLDELPFDLNALDDGRDNSSESENSSSDSDDIDDDTAPESGNEDKPTQNPKTACKRAIQSASKLLQSGNSRSASIKGPQLFTMHDETLPDSDVKRHLTNAYGAWEMPFDPTARMFPGLPLDLCRFGNQGGSTGAIATTTTTTTTANSSETTSSKETDLRVTKGRDYFLETLEDIQKTKAEEDRKKAASANCHNALETRSGKVPSKVGGDKKAEGGTAVVLPSGHFTVKTETIAKPVPKGKDGVGEVRQHKITITSTVSHGTTTTKTTAKANSLADCIGKLPPEVFKLMKEETLLRAFNLASASKKPADDGCGDTNPAGAAVPGHNSAQNKPTHPKSAGTTMKDLENIDWKDTEALKTIYEMHAAKYGTGLPNGVPGDDRGDETDDDEESLHSTSTDRSGRGDGTDGGKHCDCCYCEMFGHGGPDDLRFDQKKTPQIRERLRLKLKRKENQRAQGDGREADNSVENEEERTKSVENPPTSGPTVENSCAGAPATTGQTTKYYDDIPVDLLVEFINGPQEGGASKKDHQPLSAKAAKRARQKQRRKEKVVEEEKPTNKSAASKIARKDEPPVSPKKKSTREKLPNITDSSKMDCQRENAAPEIIFKPRQDIDSLEDDDDRDVEQFKRRLWDTAPRPNRAKVQLNLASIFKRKTAGEQTE